MYVISRNRQGLWLHIHLSFPYATRWCQHLVSNFKVCTC